MGQKNTRRTSHTLEDLPNSFRDDQLRQIIDDLDEENSGLGYSEIIKTGAFVSKITVWNAPSKDFKRTEALFTRTGPFVNSITKNIYEEDGSGIIAVTTATITRNGNNTVAFVNVVNTRP